MCYCSGISRGWLIEKWRKRVGVEPTGDGIARHPPVLKTGTITGPHALPWPLRAKSHGPSDRCRSDSTFILIHENPFDPWPILLP
jgi:hypothetical protein